MKDNRVTLRRHHSYNTASNKVRKVKTPGGRIVVQYRQKVAAGPKCSCGTELKGIPHLRPREYSQISHPNRTVNRTYGGVLCHKCVTDRILRSFLVGEQKAVTKVIEMRNRKKKLEQLSKKKGGKTQKKAGGKKTGKK